MPAAEMLAAFDIPKILVPPEFRIGLIIMAIVCAILFIATLLMSNRTRAVARPKKMVLQMSGTSAPIEASTVAYDENEHDHEPEETRSIATTDHSRFGKFFSTFGRARDVQSAATEMIDPIEDPSTQSAAEDHIVDGLSANDEVMNTRPEYFNDDSEFEQEEIALSPVSRAGFSIARMFSMLMEGFKKKIPAATDHEEFDDGLEAQLAAAAMQNEQTTDARSMGLETTDGSPPRYVRHASLEEAGSPTTFAPAHEPEPISPIAVPLEPSHSTPAFVDDADPAPSRVSDFASTQTVEHDTIDLSRSRTKPYLNGVDGHRPMAPISALDDEPFIDAEFVSSDPVDISFDEPALHGTHKAYHAPAMTTETSDDIPIDFDEVIDVAVHPIEVTQISERSFQAQPTTSKQPQPSSVKTASSTMTTHSAQPRIPIEPEVLPEALGVPSKIPGVGVPVNDTSSHDNDSTASVAPSSEVTSAHDLDVDAVIAQLAQDERSGELAAEQERQRLAEEEALKAKQGPMMIQAVTWTKRYLGDDSPTMDHHERIRFVRVLRDLDDFDLAGRTLYDGLREEPNPDVLVAMYDALVDAYNHDILMPAHQIFLDDHDPRIREIAARAIADLERVPT